MACIKFAFIYSRIENTRTIYNAVHLKINLVHFRVFIGALILSATVINSLWKCIVFEHYKCLLRT